MTPNRKVRRSHKYLARFQCDQTFQDAHATFTLSLSKKEQIDRKVLFDDKYYNEFIGGKIHSKHLKGIENA